VKATFVRRFGDFSGSGEIEAIAVDDALWAWQFTREWSLRLIGQYETTHTNPALAAVGAPPRVLLTA